MTSTPLKVTGTKERVAAHVESCQFASKTTIDTDQFNALVASVEQRDEVSGRCIVDIIPLVPHRRSRFSAALLLS
jgi:hypothetical protein